MSTQEFWDEEPDLLWIYRKVYMDKLKIQNELDNQQAWRIGLYVYEAISVVVHNVFKKEGQPRQSYSEKPYNFSRKPKTQEEIIEEEIRKNEELIKENLNRGKNILHPKVIEGEVRCQTIM
ncbi:MAG: hypothetical protein ACI4U9_03585 [Clostridia bacterium]